MTRARLLGIDLGTSSVKVVLTDGAGTPVAIGAREIALDRPAPGHVEQRPEAWWDATRNATRAALDAAPDVEIAGIGLSGQMHGTVLVGPDGEPDGPAIIWPDRRATDEVEEITRVVGAQRLVRIAGTLPATGFMGVTLLWLARYAPARLERARAALFPKDALRLRLTGEIATEPTDGSGSGLFDISRRGWSTGTIDALGLPTRLLPPVIAPDAVAGLLREGAAEALGLRAGIPVVAGCADQVAGAIGSGLLDPGRGAVTIGSGGQVFLPLDRPVADTRLHTFCHAPADRWTLLGAMLSAGLSLRWLRDLLGEHESPDAYARLDERAGAVAPGAEGLIFLPYLAGERAPLMDPGARGALVGLTLHHDRGHVARAVMEGVALALRHILETMSTIAPLPETLVASGNGLASPLWRRIVADVLDRPLVRPAGAERSGVGAALLAGIGAGTYRDLREACAHLPAPRDPVTPDPARVRRYDESYARFRALYPALRRVASGAT